MSATGRSLGAKYKPHFSESLEASPGRLHFAAHSHHLWPDVSREGHAAAWDDAARFADRKWGPVFETVVPKTQAHIASSLGLSDPGTLVFAPSTHEFIVRLFSCFGTSPLRILTTSSEFHSFGRQRLRWEEAGAVESVVVPTEPFDSFSTRFLKAAEEGTFDLVFVSRVFFDSGHVFADVSKLIEAVDRGVELESQGGALPWIVLDGYHEFKARPADLREVEHRCFYTAGGYKYAMSGEGICFLHCPKGAGLRPVNTGWFAGFGALESSGGEDRIAYTESGQRFAGATLEATAFYRFNAVWDHWSEQGLTVAQIHSHAQALQSLFLERLETSKVDTLNDGQLIPAAGQERGNFLTFRTDAAGAIFEKLLSANVVTDYRRDRLRFGFGIYQDENDVEELIGRLERAIG